MLRAAGWLVAAALVAVAALAPAAQATDAPGNNGTVKIHEGAFENANGEVRNEPHVCTFHLHFYFADPIQAGTWEIQQWAPTGTKGTVVLSGTYNTAGDGEDRQPATGAYELPDGHYKLFWDGDTDKHDKMKVFWVDCPETTTTTTTSGTTTTGTTTSGTTTSTTSTGGGSGTSSTTTSSSSTGGESGISSSTTTSSSSGDVQGTQGTPGVTPPSTDTVGPVTQSASPEAFRVILLGLAVLLAMVLLLQPKEASSRR